MIVGAFTPSNRYNRQPMDITNMKISLVKLMYLFLVTLLLVPGIMGIVIPGLPTTPFLLLTALLYVRGSTRMYQ